MRLVRATAARAKTGDSRSKQYDLIGRGLYPRQVHLTDKAVGWVEEELEALVRARIAARDLGLRGDERDNFIRQALATFNSNGKAA